MRLLPSQLLPALERDGFKCYVLYGSNGSIMQGIMQEVQEIMPIHHVEAGDVAAHMDFLGTSLLFGQASPITWVSLGGGSLTKEWIKNIESWPGKFLVLSVNAIPKGVIFPNFCALVPCYEANLGDSKTIIKRWSRKRSLTLDPLALEEAGQWAAEGRWAQLINLMSFLEKPHIMLEDVLKILEPHKEEIEMWFLNPVVDLHRLNSAFLDKPLDLIMLWQRMLKQIMYLVHKMHSLGCTKEDAAKSITPQIFFRHLALIHPKWWTKKRQDMCLMWLLRCEMRIKIHPDQGQEILWDFFRKKNTLAHVSFGQ